MQHTNVTTSKTVETGKAIVTTSFLYNPQKYLQKLRSKPPIKPAPSSQSDFPITNGHALQVARFDSRVLFAVDPYSQNAK